MMLDDTKKECTEMREKLIRIVAKALEMDDSEIDMHKSLLAFGIDSLSGAEILDEVGKQFNIYLEEELLYIGEPTLFDIEKSMLSKLGLL